MHIAPDETDALAHIPNVLLFPAPMAPKGHVLLGYDGHGRCPMLVDNRCSIYERRPRTRRGCDCRVFAATGVAPDVDKPAIAERAERRVFDLDTDADATRVNALQVAARFVASEPDAQALAGFASAASSAGRPAVREPDRSPVLQVAAPDGGGEACDGSGLFVERERSGEHLLDGITPASTPRLTLESAVGSQFIESSSEGSVQFFAFRSGHQMAALLASELDKLPVSAEGSSCGVPNGGK